eukprot:5313612-Pyramimonas_sp.AAC.1
MWICNGVGGMKRLACPASKLYVRLMRETADVPARTVRPTQSRNIKVSIQESRAFTIWATEGAIVNVDIPPLLAQALELWMTPDETALRVLNHHGAASKRCELEEASGPGRTSVASVNSCQILPSEVG